MVLVERTPYKSIEVETGKEKGNVIIISEGEKVKFIVDATGEVKEGVVVGFKGSKPEKVEIEIIPVEKSHVERWMVTDMIEGSLQLVSDNEDKTNNEDSEDDEE